jgi:capsid protein
MAQAPLKYYLEQKWAAYQSNNLVESASQSADRKQVPLLDNDSQRNVSVLGRKTLLSMGRYLYANCSFVRGAIDEMVRLALSSFEPQFMGKDKEWGKLAKSWMEGNDRFIDIRGVQYSMDVDRRLIGLGYLVDGEIGIVLTQDDQGNGRIQLIPSHRIGSRTLEPIVQGGPYDGARIIDGTIVDDYGSALAYRVFKDSIYNTMEFQDVSVNDMILAFIPDYPDQLRGFSRLGYDFFNCEDVREARLFDLIAGKIAASYAIVEHTETGTADKTKKVFSAGATAADSTTGAAQSIPNKLVQPGTILTVKAGSNQKIEIPNSDRPSVNMMEFQGEIIRTILNGQGWPYEISHKADLNGGALRVVVEKANAKCEELRTLLICPVIDRINNFRLAKAIKNKRLPETIEPFLWRYHGPAEITADKKYDSQVAISEMAAGLTSPQRETAKRNAVLDEVQDECVEAAKQLQSKMEKAGVTILIGSAQVDKTPPPPDGELGMEPSKVPVNQNDG